MTGISLRNVSVDFPIFNSTTRSLKSQLIRSVGGTLGAYANKSVGVVALKDVNLDLRPGDRLAVVGHNGAGKSTLLRVLSGAYEPKVGSVEISGKVSSLLDLAMGMDSELSGRQNIILRGVFLGLTFREARDLVEGVAEFSELGQFLDLPMRTYSSGMMLRLAFGVSTAVLPDIIILDEMIGVGDAAFIHKAGERMNSFLANASILVLASHNWNLLRDYCNKAILMERGSIIASGTVNDVISAASQIGSPS